MLRPSATGLPNCTETYPCVAESAAAVRHLLTVSLDTWHLHELADDAALIVTELVANAVEHAPAEAIRVTVIRLAADVVRIGVIDTERGEPSLREAGPCDENGRGLAIVAALAERWGVDRMPCGKRVWADLRVDGAPGGAV